MADTDRTAGGSHRHPEVDWDAAAESPEFKQLVSAKRRFVIPATAFFMVWYFGFVILAGYAPDFMGEEFITDGLTVGYTLALSQFVMTWVLGWLYLRRADRTFDPLAARARDAVTGGTDGRFERTDAGERPATGTVSTEEPRR